MVRQNQGNKVRWGVGPSPFDLILSTSGDDFAVPWQSKCFFLAFGQFFGHKNVEGQLSTRRNDNQLKES